MYKGNKTSKWIYYFYDQSLKIVSNYSLGTLVDETYYTLNDELFSGKFIYYNTLNDLKEIRKIKLGLRNGKTITYQDSTGEKLKVEVFKKGVLKK